MTDRSSELHFHCRACGLRFEALPTRTEPRPEREFLPTAYFSGCRSCGAEAEQVAWEVNLAKAWGNATGPKTEAGKAASAANLKGHPTPEEAKITRFNAMKHGVFAETAQYFPARPGQYPHCETCEHFNNGCNPYPVRGHKNPPACLKRTELFMDFTIAFETRDPKMLNRYQARLQALVWQLTNDMILTIIKDGVSLRTPEWAFDKEGTLRIASYIDESGDSRTIQKVEAHPLLKLIIEYMNRNGMTLPDSGMTMKIKDEQETVSGFLEQDKKAIDGASDFRERQTAALEKLGSLIERSRQRASRDPVLLEHQALEKQDGSASD